MTRERWFYAQNHQRRGPVALSELVEKVLKQGEPRSVLVWRKGFADWTQAEDVPEVERRLAPFLARKAPEEVPRRAPASEAPPEAPLPPAPAPPRGVNPMLLYGGVATGVIVTGLVAWLLWPQNQPVAPPVVPLGGTSPENAPAVVIPAPGGAAPAPAGAAADPAPASTPSPTPPPAAPTPAPTAPPAATAPSGAAVANQEQELPLAQLKKLRQVAAWSETTLELTIYNGTAWRITEVYVKIQRYVGNEVVDDETPFTLVPPGATVDEGVASLLSKVAPDRKKPGVNPNDTGKFAGIVGPAPEGFRCEIIAARGYPPVE